jgi:NAD(P)H dehydrogenase (quinone)
MNTLVVVAHPRQSSLTWTVADLFCAAIVARGHAVERASLIQEGFDPTLRGPDEPDWADPGKGYSAVVHAEMRRIERNVATVLVFPVWWWSMPAVMKGWIDRVWNNGWAYGAHEYPHRRVWMIGIAGVTKGSYAQRGYDDAMRVQLEVGVLEYCGIQDRRMEILHGAIEGAQYVQEILARARELGAEF